MSLRAAKYSTQTTRPVFSVMIIIIIYWNTVLLFRVYSDPARQDLETPETCMLTDEFQQDLKSMKDYKMALKRVLNKCPEL